MTNELWKLVATYELVLQLGQTRRPVRIEVLNSATSPSRYRARLWDQSTYNLYPALLNSEPQGNDLRRFHSSDDLNKEITSLIADDPSLIEGKEFGSEAAFLEELMGLVTKYQNMLNAN